MKTSLIVLGGLIVAFGLIWHFIPLFETGTIFLLNELCVSHVEVYNPAAGRSAPQWMLDGGCIWLPYVVIGSYALLGAGGILIIVGFKKVKKISKDF